MTKKLNFLGENWNFARGSVISIIIIFGMLTTAISADEETKRPELIKPHTTGGTCTSTALCLYSDPVTCTGVINCPAGVNETTGQVGYATCDNSRHLCPLGPILSCKYQGISYPNGSSHTFGAQCSGHHGDSYCVGGIWAGDACDSSGDCYATCAGGVWQPG